MDLRTYTSVTKRRQAVEQYLSIELSHIGSFSFDEEASAKRNCENMIGAVQVPVGIAGPIEIRSLEFEKQSYYLPLATTEGALVASVNRGCKAITESGGAVVISKKVGITRAPVFVVENLLAGKQCIEWIETNIDRLREITAATSSHLTLIEITPWQLGRNVFLRFKFDTQDA